MLKQCMTVAVAFGLAAPAAFAQEPAPPPGRMFKPCEQIVQACERAGFVKGDAREGYGLYKDCAYPIAHGTAPPSRTDRPLPSVPPDLIAACRQKNPNFGLGRREGEPPPPR
jgi:hypothetical protein